jgi:hypothetical protein
MRDDLMLLDGTDRAAVVYTSASRTAVVYPRTPARQDPRLVDGDPSTAWLVVLLLLLLVPPLGWLQLSRRHDVDGRLRLAVAVLSFSIALAGWAEVLQLRALR